MIKVDLRDLQIGDEVVRFDKSWLSTDFISHKILIHDASVINRMKENGVKYAYINPRKKSETKEEGESAQEDFESVVETPEAEPLKNLKQASGIYSESLKIVSNVLTDVRSGKMFNSDAIKYVSENITEMTLKDSRVMTSVTRLKQYDNYTFHHSMNVSIYAASLAAHLGMGKTGVEIAANSGLLHDIGKMFVPEEILNKPGALTEEEFAQVKSHVELGYDYLKKQGVGCDKLSMVAEHHERNDGTGYPYGLRDKDISIFGKIGAIVDIYDAMTSDRVYHKGIPATSALKMMFQWADRHINKSVFEFFIKSIGIYPVGSVVVMSNQDKAVVAKINNKNPLTPVLVVFMDRDGNFVPPRVTNLARSVVTGQKIVGLYEKNISVPDDVLRYIDSMHRL